MIIAAPSFRHVPRIALVIGLLAATACREEESADTLTSPSVSAGAQPAAQDDWLDVGAAEPPEAFLARKTGADPAALASSFPKVAGHFTESPRMVANRLAQLWQESQTAPDAPGLTQLMAELTPAPDDPRVSLGTLLNQYRVLRERGESHGTAIAEALEHAR